MSKYWVFVESRSIPNLFFGHCNSSSAFICVHLRFLLFFLFFSVSSVSPWWIFFFVVPIYLPPTRASTVSIVCRNTWPLLRNACISFGQSSTSCVATTPLRPTVVGTDNATSRMP
jgi:hypothetical protein